MEDVAFLILVIVLSWKRGLVSGAEVRGDERYVKRGL